MSRKKNSRVARAVLCALVALVFLPGATASEEFQLSVGSDFAERVELETFRQLAVQDQGRVKTFDSLAREKLKYVNSRLVGAIDPSLLYLDMLMVPEHYAGARIIRIKNKALRQRLVQGVRSLVPPGDRTGTVAEEELDRIAQGGNVSMQFLETPVVRSVLGELERDLRRSGKAVQDLRRARTLADPRVLRSMLLVIPPPGGRDGAPWHSLDEVLAKPAAPHDHNHSGMQVGGIPGLGDGQEAALRTMWAALEKAWRFQRPEEASQALSGLAKAFAEVEPALYPEASRLAWEHWYYKHNKLTAGWLIYFFALPFLLMAFVYGSRWAGWAGLSLFGVAFLVHTFSLILRWWLAGRIPNANMFEAIIASAWFGGVFAIVMEFLLRNSRLRFVSALCAASYAMFAMMFGNFMTVQLNSDITTVMPVLDRTIWLYIHVNVTIASYALIAFAAFTGGGYLLGRFFGKVMPGRFGGQWNASSRVSGGASSVILGGMRGDGPGQQTLAKTLDGATMVFLELAFIALWTGTVLGAVWADVSWGRPWGWDPKEVFALNTWLVFLVLLHIRHKVRDKAFWTALLAVIGFAVMLFNWIAVNFVIVGLHSYA